jgi:hypothetical protein
VQVRQLFAAGGVGKRSRGKGKARIHLVAAVALAVVGPLVLAPAAATQTERSGFVGVAQS